MVDHSEAGGLAFVHQFLFFRQSRSGLHLSYVLLSEVLQIPGGGLLS